MFWLREQSRNDTVTNPCVPWDYWNPFYFSSTKSINVVSLV